VRDLTQQFGGNLVRVFVRLLPHVWIVSQEAGGIKCVFMGPLTHDEYYAKYDQIDTLSKDEIRECVHYVLGPDYREHKHAEDVRYRVECIRNRFSERLAEIRQSERDALRDENEVERHRDMLGEMRKQHDDMLRQSERQHRDNMKQARHSVWVAGAAALAAIFAAYYAASQAQSASRQANAAEVSLRQTEARIDRASQASPEQTTPEIPPTQEKAPTVPDVKQ
jgi:hypothetical protein